MPLHTVFIGLPVQEPDQFSASANVPLAAGCLAAYASRRLGGEARFTILSRDVVDRGGDEGILRHIEALKPGLLCFTLYLWNRERSLHLAREAKRRIPGLVTAAGGPEAALLAPAEAFGGNGRFGAAGFPGIDAAVVGEGEAAFLQLLLDLLAGQPPRRIYAAEGLLDLREAPNPYLSGHLPITPEGPVYLETMRGCPNRCSYCYYGKAYGGIRRFPERVVEGVFALAAKAGAAEIYLMDPSFNAVRNMDDRLRRIIRLNPGRIPLHTELRLESITPERARLLREAGLRSVEAGLQSVHPRVLRNVRRGFQRGKFEEGARLLLDQGIEVRTGVILGLPGDTLGGFLETLDFVMDNNLASGLEIYPLAILPGTELRIRASEFGIDFMPRPPYWTLSTPDFPQESMYEAIALAEEKLGIEYFRPIPPRFSSPPGWTAFADLGRPGAFERLEARPEEIASDLTLLVPGRLLRDSAAVRRLLALGEALLRSCPFTFYKLVVEEDSFPSEKTARAVSAAAEAFFNPAHPANRGRTFQIDPQGMFSTRLYLLTRSPETAARLHEEARSGGPLRADPVFRCEPGSLSRAETRRLLRGRIFAAYDEAVLGKGEFSILKRIYREHPALLLRLNGGAVSG